jgi:hypothetical protein
MDWLGECDCGRCDARDVCNPWYRPSSAGFLGVKVHRPEGHGNFCRASRESQLARMSSHMPCLTAPGVGSPSHAGWNSSLRRGPGRAHFRCGSYHHLGHLAGRVVQPRRLPNNLGSAESASKTVLSRSSSRPLHRDALPSQEIAKARAKEHRRAGHETASMKRRDVCAPRRIVALRQSTPARLPRRADVTSRGWPVNFPCAAGKRGSMMFTRR